MVALDFNENTLDPIVSKSNNLRSSSVANELAGSPPKGDPTN